MKTSFALGAPDLDLRHRRLRDRLLGAGRIAGLEMLPSEKTSTLAHRLLTLVRERDDDTLAWLAYVAFCGSMPTARSLATFRREIATSRESAVLIGGLGATLDDAIASRENADREVQFVEGGLLVDVTFCAC